MTRLILITSGKGGVGKTTLTSNLSAALTDFGENVIAMDANLTTPNLGLHTGMHLAPNTLHDVLKRKKKLKDAIYPHPYGFKIIPASMSLDDLRDVDVGRLPEITFSLLGKADYIIMDCAAGLGREAISALSASDEIIIITNPNLPAVTDALKILKLAQQSELDIVGVVVNRVRGNKNELSSEEIEELLGVPVIAEIPEDKNIFKSIAKKQNIFEYAPYSPAAIEIKKLASKLTGKPYNPPKLRKPRNLIQRMAYWLTR